MAPTQKKSLKPGPKKGKEKASASRRSRARVSSPLHPNVDLTQTIRWPKLKEGVAVTPVQAVIMKRQDATVEKMNHIDRRIMHIEELLQGLSNKVRGNKPTTRRARVDSDEEEDELENDDEASQAETSASKTTVNRKPKTRTSSSSNPTEELESSAPKAAARTLKKITNTEARIQAKSLVQGGDLFSHLMREYRKWIENAPSKKKAYLSNAGHCADDAMEFVTALGTLIAKDLRNDEDRVSDIHEILSGFSQRFVVEIYINCGFELREENARAAQNPSTTHAQAESSQHSDDDDDLPTTGKECRKAVMEARKRLAEDSQSGADRPEDDDAWQEISVNTDMD